VTPTLATPARLALFCAAIAGLLALGAACGQPKRPSQSSTVAPRVSDPPAAAGQVIVHPCTALTDAQVTEVGLPPDIEHRTLIDAVSARCLWEFTRPATGVASLAVGWAYDTPGLAALYARRTEQAYFQPIAILGYPAVFANKEDWRADGHCVLHVGVSDTRAFFVAINTHGEDAPPDPCETARRAATTVVRNLRAA
jgi:Protein of unknown function (DUF3558)